MTHHLWRSVACVAETLPSSLLSARSRDDHRSRPDITGRRFPRSAGRNVTSGHLWTSPNQTHDIFEGTEQIQQLVISRAISEVRID